MQIYFCGAIWLMLLIIRFYIAHLDDVKRRAPFYDLPPLEPPVVRRQFNTWYEEQWNTPRPPKPRRRSRPALSRDPRKRKLKRKRKPSAPPQWHQDDWR